MKAKNLCVYKKNNVQFAVQKINYFKYKSKNFIEKKDSCGNKVFNLKT
jgi:hypothetical protein